MALRAVLEHPKFSRLKKLIGQPRCYTLGCLETLWHFTGRFTPQGDIGKYPDAEIEAWLEWPGEPGLLIEALIESRWIDRDLNYRLVVHDWKIHADATTKLAIKRSGTDFVVPVSIPRRDTVATLSPVLTNLLGLPEPVPEPEPVPVPDAAPEAVATKPQQQPQPKKKLEPPQPTPSAFDPSGNLDRSELARKLVAELAPKHPVPGPVHYANVAVEIILASAVDPKAVCESARENHAAAVKYWREFKPKFIPNLGRWFNDGDYMYAPNRDAPINGGGNYFDQRLKKALEREEKERREGETKHGK